MGPLSGTPAHLDTDGPKGWVAMGRQSLASHEKPRVCIHMRAPDMAQPLPALSVAIPAPPGAEAWPAGQSTFSTLPMIFSSKTGKMASSSRTSSNTTPQSNSSLTFLK